MHRPPDAQEALGRGRNATVAERLSVLLIVAALFTLHTRWIFVHFSSDGYLCDSGWFAFLFEQADPLFRNPTAVVGTACAGVNAPTFLAHHLSPHILLFGAPFTLLDVSGIDILAYHQGLFFGLFFVAVYLVVAAARLPARDRFVAMLAALPVGAAGNALLEGAAYPHYETAMFALASLAIAAWSGGQRSLFVGCLVWLPLVREDGGLYVAAVCGACFALQDGEHRKFAAGASTLAIAAGIGIVVSAVAFLVKAQYFPGFNAFSKNFAGDHWSHVTPAFVLERAQAALTNWNIAPVVLGSLVLAIVDRRYVTGIVVLSPLFLVHVLSVRPEHGYFTLYYALPWLLPVLLWLVVLVSRMSTSRASAIEKALVAVLSLALTAPVQAVIGTRQQRWPVAQQALTRPVTNIASMKEFARWVRTVYSSPVDDRGRHRCASMGIAALIPDDLTPEEVIDPGSDVSACRTVLLLRRDMHYDALRTRIEALGFQRVAERENAEFWMMDGD
jgi:hypothetical protein